MSWGGVNQKGEAAMAVLTANLDLHGHFLEVTVHGWNHAENAVLSQPVW